MTLCHLGAFSDEFGFGKQAEESAGAGVEVDVADVGKVIDVGMMPF